MANFLFDRYAEIIIGTRVGNTNAPKRPPRGRLIKTRLNFIIDKTSDSNSNRANIKVYNMSQDTRNSLEARDQVALLRVGYVGNIQQLFFGNIIRVTNFRNGADIVTQLECGDAENILRTAHIEVGLGPGATNIQLIDEAIDKLRISRGSIANIPVKQFQKGFSYSGTVKSLLDQLITNEGVYRWSIQNGVLRIVKNDMPDDAEIIDIGPNSGLISYPTKTPIGVEFESLLIPHLIPDRAVRLSSSQFQGIQGGIAGNVSESRLINAGSIIKVNKCTFFGDTFDGPWNVNAECVFIGGASG